MQPATTTARREKLASLACGALLLLAPFASFAQHNGYGLLRPELLAGMALLAALGAALGAVMALLGTWGRVIGVAALTTLLVDFQTQTFAAGGPPAWAGFCAALALCAALRRHVATIAATAAAALVVAALLTPAGATIKDVRHDPDGPAAQPPPPPFLHLILDEHIGPAGIPPEFDRGGHVRERVTALFADRGFSLYGHAFSRYPVTNSSLSHLVNFSTSPRAFRFTQGSEVVRVTENAYFEAMTRRGYTAHVYQTDYMDFCSAEGEIAIARCLTYPLETIAAIERAPLALAPKLRLIFGMYTRLSPLATALRNGAFHAGATWVAGGERVSSVSAMQVLPAIEDGLAAAKAGELHFVHLALPHYPYAYDRACALRQDPADWLAAHDLAAFPHSNTAASRALRYPLYLEQLECTLSRLEALFDRLEQAGVLERATVLVHGDHGSRLQLVPPRAGLLDEMSERDFVDAYSTLLAIRQPGDPPEGRVDGQMRGIDDALEQLIRDGRLADSPAVPNPRVFVGSGLSKRELRALPRF